MLTLAELIGESPGIVAVREQVERLLQRQSDARRRPPLLIQGETGTGKGLLARAIHRAGPRAAGPFVDVNCAAIPESLLEAELFGFERGAFTDARQAKAGLFQAAHRGMIFLDEVELLSEGFQGKLLKVIEERAVRRLGSTRSEPVDVWIIAATNEDLAAAIRARRFREDLYHRLAVVPLWLPPLRERGRDILLLAEHFLARACADYALPPKTFAPDARAAFLAYRWPGNVRELANVMERVALLSEALLVTAEMLGLPEAPLGDPGGPARGETLPLEEAVWSVEREHILNVLRQTNWNISRAAGLLGISRNTLRYRIEKHGLRRGAVPPPPRQAERPAAPAPAIPRIPATVPGLAAAPPRVRWERRHLTLLRATLAFPPGERSSLDWSRTLEIFMEKVQSFGGRVEEVSPTGIVAAFGLEPVEDAPRRAVHVAMAIQKAAERARPDGAEKLAVKIGIHVGQFLVGQVGGALEIDLDTKREAWTTLEALVDRAELDAILVSAAAAPFIERRFDLAQVRTSEKAPEPAYRLVGHERTGFGGRVTRFVGRADELQLLRSRLASAMRGHGQVVGIVGEAGIGKSRLLLEFRQSLVGEPVIYREGCCLSYGSGIPYLPVLEMLRSNFRLSETDTPEAIAEKVRWSLDTIGIDAEAAAPYLLHLLGVKEGTDRLAELSPETIQARTFESLRQMSLKGSRQRPLIMAVEDLHWIDSASEEYFASLVGSLAGTPILLLFTYRPGYRPSWIEKSNATQIALQPLSPEESLTVLQSALPAEQIPDPLAQLILAKAEGNPFFLEELARTVGEQGDLRATFAVPDTIQGVLLARIDRLPAEPKQLLQTASVLGREFSQRLLGALLEGPGALAPQLRELMRQEFLYERSGAEEPVYVFKHALTQEVVYESLLSPRRQALHAAAGRALEALYAGRLEEVYDSLAYHYSKTEEAAKAVEYLTRFARKTARNHAHVEAVMALQEALAHVERLPEEARDPLLLDLVLRQVQSLNFLGRNQESLDLLIQQQERVKRRQDPSQAAPYYFSLGVNYSLLGDQWRAVQSLKRALQEAQRGGDERTMGRAHALLTLENCWSGHLHEGIEHGRHAVALLERTQQRYWLALTHFYVAITYYLIGEVEPALEAAARAQAIGEAIAHPVIQSNAASITGLIYALAGERAAGIEACQRGLDLSPDPLTTATALGFLGYAYLEKGDADQAIPLLEQAAKQKAQFRYQQSWFTTLLGEAFLLSGQIGKARDLVLRGLELTRDVEYRYGVGWAQRTLGRIAQATGTFSEAETHFHEALQTFALIQSRFEVARTRLDLAKLAHAQGNHAAAATHLRETYHAFKTLRVPRHVEHTRQLAAELGVSLSEEPA